MDCSIIIENYDYSARHDNGFVTVQENVLTILGIYILIYLRMNYHDLEFTLKYFPKKIDDADTKKNVDNC